MILYNSNNLILKKLQKVSQFIKKYLYYNYSSSYLDSVINIILKKGQVFHELSLFLWLRLFPALRLFRSLEYLYNQVILNEKLETQIVQLLFCCCCWTIFSR